MSLEPLRPAIVIPAAGASSRMRGRDKLLELVRGRTLLADRVQVASSITDVVIVTLPPRALAPERWDALREHRAQLVSVESHAQGMSASLRAAVGALPARCPGLMVLPADMPDITAADIGALLDAFDSSAILRGTSADGTPGHPVLFPRRDFAALAEVHGDKGGRELLKAAADRVRLIPLPGDHALTDLDTPEDWADWRAAQKQRPG